MGEVPSHHHVPFVPGRVAQEESCSDEVSKVVELVTTHAYERPEESLGVIAMGVKHADGIGEALRRARQADPSLDAFMSKEGRERFFVKNLERVQGDERDAIILTIGYGKLADGRMQYRFGPINQDGGERRLNVAVTRARTTMTVVSSFGSLDMDPNRLNAEDARMLARYLAYAESGGTDLGPHVRERPPLNPFEIDVRDKLTAAGIPLIPQYGVSITRASRRETAGLLDRLCCAVPDRARTDGARHRGRWRLLAAGPIAGEPAACPRPTAYASSTSRTWDNHLGDNRALIRKPGHPGLEGWSRNM